MRRLLLPDGFLRSSRNVRAFLPDGYGSMAATPSLRSAVESFFTERERVMVEIPAEEHERYRIPQIASPALCAVLWAGCVDASGPGGRIGRLDHHFTAFV